MIIVLKVAGVLLLLAYGLWVACSGSGPDAPA
jgi:hypothetical protein